MIPAWTQLFVFGTFCLLFLKLATLLVELCTFLISSGIILWSSWQLTVLTRRKLLNKRVDPARKAVVITGCDSGFGNSLAHKLADEGFPVYACCLQPESEGCRELVTKGRASSLKVIKVDVTKEEDVEEARRSIIGAIEESGQKLWALVNNAGVITCGEVEWNQTSAFDKIFQVNVIGTIRMTRAFLPTLRSHKGRVVNMGSVSSKFCAPGFAAYSLSKAALSSFTCGLRREMFKWDVKVIEIQPDAYKSPMANESFMFNALDVAWQRTENAVKFDYGLDYYDEFKRYVAENVSKARKFPEEVVGALFEAVTSQEPELKYLCCGIHNRLILWLFDVLPAQWLEYLVQFYIVRRRPAAYGKARLTAGQFESFAKKLTAAQEAGNLRQRSYQGRGL